MADKPHDIRVESKGADPYSIRVTDSEGKPINGVRSITWRCRYPGIPTFVIEGDGLDIDVGGALRGSEAEAKLGEIREWLDRRIAEEGDRSDEYHEAVRYPPDFLVGIYRQMRADFFGGK